MKESTSRLYGQVVLWTFIGLAGYLLLEAVVVGTLSLLNWVAPRAASLLMALAGLAAPGVAYALARKRLAPEKQWAERNGLWVATLLVYLLVVPFLFLGALFGGGR